MNVPGEFDAPPWRAAFGTAVSYGAILLALFVLLFVVPFLIFAYVPPG